MENSEYLNKPPPAVKKLMQNADAPKIPTALENNPGYTDPAPIINNKSKKQLKLEEYQQRRRERQKERQKREAIENGLPAQKRPPRKEFKKKQLVAGSNKNILRIVIDLDCDDLMSDRDVAKCAKQCLRIYTINRRSENPVQIHLTGIKTDGNIHKALQKNFGWENWQVKYHFDKDHLEVFRSTSDLIYLTSELDTVLDKLDPKNVYCIGGLVDHNRHKNYCHDRATKAGLRTARLPLGENVDMKTRSVLSTYHVFEILVHVAEGKCWCDAILQTVQQLISTQLKKNIFKKMNSLRTRLPTPNKKI